MSSQVTFRNQILLAKPIDLTHTHVNSADNNHQNRFSLGTEPIYTFPLLLSFTKLSKHG